jgi:hypothetical protein
MRFLLAPLLLLGSVDFVKADLPVVDLGYALQRATVVNVSISYLVLYHLHNSG